MNTLILALICEAAALITVIIIVGLVIGLTVLKIFEFFEK